MRITIFASVLGSTLVAITGSAQAQSPPPASPPAALPPGPPPAALPPGPPPGYPPPGYPPPGYPVSYEAGRLRSPYRSVGMRNAGIALTAVGAAHLVAGAALLILSAQESQQPCNGGGCADVPNGFAAGLFGGGFVVVGVILAAVGVPLLVVGSQPAVSAPVALGERRISPFVPRVSASGVRWSF